MRNIIEIHKDRYINYVIFAIGRISRFEYSITDPEIFFKIGNLLKKIGELLQTLDHLFKNWGTFSKIGELSQN